MDGAQIQRMIANVKLLVHHQRSNFPILEKVLSDEIFHNFTSQFGLNGSPYVLPVTGNFQMFYQVSVLVPVSSKMPNAKQSARQTLMLETKIMPDQVFCQNVHVKVKIVFGLLEEQSNPTCSASVSIADHFDQCPGHCWHGHFWIVHFGLLLTKTVHIL